uniref:Uncharacterized protein n=1 Tax=Arundo donax TaxID=35708 RepID=A0A0A8YRH1_ARUDO
MNSTVIKMYLHKKSESVYLYRSVNLLGKSYTPTAKTKVLQSG